jgi:gliding motility-associated-like protein
MVFKRVGFIVMLLLSMQSLLAQEIEASMGEYTFFENKGQWPNGVLYRAKMASGSIYLEQGRILYYFTDYSQLQATHANLQQNLTTDSIVFKQNVVTANFLGANQNVSTSKKFPTTHYQNYFLGTDKSHWATNVFGYHHITYNELYPGIDLIVFEKDASLKYEYHLEANANPNLIQVKYEGEKKMKIDKDGHLIVYCELGEIQEMKPYAYQIKNGRVKEVECEYTIKNDVVSYKLGDYDAELELIIDPELVFATYAGSTTDNFGMTATYAYDGKGYSGGIIYGNTYPVPGPAWNTTPNITMILAGSPTTDVFISKYNKDGTAMLWTNFIGGGDNTQGTETVHSLICDKFNNVYLYGATSSLDFPIEGGFQTDHAGGNTLNVLSNGTNFGTVGTDIYVAKFSADGLNLMGSTYIGGSANDGVNFKISSGVYASPTSYDSLTKNYGDQFRGEIMIDSLYNIIVTSSTWSPDFPVESGFQMVNGGKQDAVLFKISADFSTLLWSSYYGGANNDAGYSVKIDSSYNVIFAGGTCSYGLAGTSGGLQPGYNGGKADGFIAKISEDGDAIIQSTYIGTTDYDQTFFIEIDRWDNIYVLGQSLGTMPTSPGVYSNPGSKQFIWKLNPTLSATEFTTVFGNGSSNISISPSAFLVDVCGNIYVSGWGGNILTGIATTGMPTTPDAFLETSPNGFDFYMIVLERNAESLLYATYMGGDESREHVDGGTSRFDSYGIVYQSVCGGCGAHSDFPTTPGAWSALNLSTNCNNVLYKFDFEIVPVASFEVALLEGCAPLTLEFENESNDTINFTWDFGPGTEIISGGASPVVLFTEPGIYEVVLTITDTICGLTDTAKKVITVYEELLLEVPNDTVVCGDFTMDLSANSYGSATSFHWSDDPGFGTTLNDGPMDSVITITPITTTTYYVKVSNGWPLCDLIDSVTVVYGDGAISVGGDTTICLGDTVNLLAINLYPDYEIVFDWAPNPYLIYELDGLAVGLPPFSMYYYLSATTDFGCSFYDSVWVEVKVLDPTIVYATATPDLVAAGATTVLEAFPIGYNYTWSPAEDVTDPNARVTETQVYNEKTYSVEVFDGVCAQTATVVVKTYEFVCGDVYIFVPNAFSPNGDGENDKLYVRGQNLEEITFKIFNRWGELVFESIDQEVGWDGTFKGKVVDPDVYVYHLQVVCFDGQENLIKGNITVLR